MEHQQPSPAAVVEAAVLGTAVGAAASKSGTGLLPLPGQVLSQQGSGRGLGLPMRRGHNGGEDSLHGSAAKAARMMLAGERCSVDGGAEVPPLQLSELARMCASEPGRADDAVNVTRCMDVEMKGTDGISIADDLEAQARSSDVHLLAAQHTAPAADVSLQQTAAAGSSSTASYPVAAANAHHQTSKASSGANTGAAGAMGGIGAVSGGEQTGQRKHFWEHNEPALALAALEAELAALEQAHAADLMRQQTMTPMGAVQVREGWRLVCRRGLLLACSCITSRCWRVCVAALPVDAGWTQGSQCCWCTMLLV